MLEYPAMFEPDRLAGGYVVTFPDFPEAITQGESLEEARRNAAEVLLLCVDEYVRRRRELPEAGGKRGRSLHWVRLPALAAAKVELYRAMRLTGIRKAQLARRLGWQKSQVDRLLALAHASRLDQIELALGALGKRLDVQVRDAA